MHDLGTLGERSSSEARAMNNHAEVVGHSSFGALNTAHAVLFSKGEVIDLNDLAPYGDGFASGGDRSEKEGGKLVEAAGIEPGQLDDLGAVSPRCLPRVGSLDHAAPPASRPIPC